MRILMFWSNYRSHIVLKQQRIFRVHRLDRKGNTNLKHNTSSRILKVGDKVLKENSKNKSRKGGKLDNPWTGPFYIQEVLGKGRYRLKTESGEILKQTIHCARLKLYCDPIEVEAYGDDSKQDEVGDDNICNEVKSSKQEVIEGSGEGEKSCMKLLQFKKVRAKILKKLHLIKPFWIRTSSHATTYHHCKVQLLYCKLIMYY